MLDIPSRYKIDKTFSIKTFITADLTPKEKKRFKEEVIEIKLSHQIAGEEIPSFVNDEYDCQVILFFTVQLKKLKYANFVGPIIQGLVKSLCVIEFYDHSSQQVYCFSHKRLNIQDKSQIVVEETVYSSLTSMQFTDEINGLLKEYIAYDNIYNRGNKLDFYLEMMIKAYIISNLSLWSGTRALLASNVWYNRDTMLKLYHGLKEVEQRKKELKSARTIAEQSTINAKLKKSYAQFKEMMEKT
ncbi:DUF4391 domain-containing protein [Heliorestis convoluta]|uniref:DUF4391 domain-containing protein n=1 Tax=Heliorestis convoluta TaxID=356322 RepID=A0A5Q2N637_9FIRM|nr:DUF4391 domain-containing protein [Heliorestis convoluta]QGG48035.1 hypothetical protein FTV88_1937 [Heliorestis convoluta]